MKVPRRILALLVSLLVLPLATVQAQESSGPADLIGYPDLIVYNGKIVTMDDTSLTSSTGTVAQAIAVRGARILSVGSDQDILGYAGPKTRKIDLKGRTVVPGFIDTHIHAHNDAVSWWGALPENIAKSDAIVKNFALSGKSFADINRGIELIVKEQMANPLPGQWAHITLRDETGTTSGELARNWAAKDGKRGTRGMSRAELDRLAPKLPVLIQANPSSYFINKAAQEDFFQYYGEHPTDEIEALTINSALIFTRSLVVDRYFDSHLNELKDLLKNYLGAMRAAGVTTYSSHITGVRFSPAFQRLMEAGEMPIRLAWTNIGCTQLITDVGGCVLRVGDLKNLGNEFYWNTGFNFETLDTAGNEICTSITDIPPEEKAKEVCSLAPGKPRREAVYAVLRNRFRFAAGHAYGDQDINYLMDLMEQVTKDNPDITLNDIRALRITADHCFFYPSREQLPRMKKLGMIISCGFHPELTPQDRRWKVYGEKYNYRSAPVQSILKAGVMATAETEVFSQWLGGKGPTYHALLDGFLTRKNRDGVVTSPEEIIDRETLMKMSTIWAAYFVLREKDLGSLEPGKLADFLVLNKDYFTVPLDQVPTVFPLMTVFGGQPVVVRKEIAAEFGLPPTGVQVDFSFKPPTSSFGGGS